MSTCTKLSSEDVADCHGSQEPLDSSPQKKCSVTSFLKTHAFVLLTVAGIALGERFNKTFQKIIFFIVQMEKKYILDELFDVVNSSGSTKKDYRIIYN